jgi:polar amino acid transport system substrate-binding protein
MKLRAVLSLLALVTMGVTACGSSSAGGGGGSVTPPPASDLVAAGTLTVGSDISYAPQEYFDPPGSNTATGFDIDVAKAISAKLGLTSKPVNGKFDNLIADLGAKKFDILLSAFTITDERKKTVDFVPYFSAGQHFVLAKSSSLHPAKVGDLCGQTVAVQKGTAEEDAVNAANDKSKSGPCGSKPIKLLSYDTDTEALQQLKKGQAAVHFTDSPVANYEVKQDSTLVVSGGTIAVAPEGIVVRKGDSAMLKAIQDAFKAIEDDGTYDNILSKWNQKEADIRKASSS